MERIFCKDCGKELNASASFCPFCGNRITISENVNKVDDTYKAKDNPGYKAYSDKSLNLTAWLFGIISVLTLKLKWPAVSILCGIIGIFFAIKDRKNKQMIRPLCVCMYVIICAIVIISLTGRWI